MKTTFIQIATCIAIFFGFTVQIQAQNWEVVGQAGFVGYATFTSMAVSNDNEPYVASNDWGGEGDVFSVKKFDGNAWTTVGTLPQGEPNHMVLAFNDVDNAPYVAYGSFGVGVSVMKFNGNDWELVGAAGFTEGQAGNNEYSPFSFAFSNDGEPYVAYRDVNGATVKKFDGNNWTTVGAAGFSAGGVGFISLAFSPAGEPYVAYADYANGNKTTVMKFNGNAWTTVGAAGISGSDVAYVSLAFGNNNEPYVAYTDWHNLGKATVMKFSGNSWTSVGTAAFSEGIAYYCSLKIRSDGVPFLAFQDQANESKATVMQFDGNNWVSAGQAGFSAGSAGLISLDFNSSGQPYVGFTDGANQDKVTVMRNTGFMNVEDIVQTAVTLYPNPTKDVFYISGISEDSTVKIIDITGKLVREITGLSENEFISTNGLTNGIYLIHIQDKKGSIVKKLVVSNGN